MIDLHTHILPRLDDGARSVDESLDMARAAAAAGVRAIAGTPHVRDDYPTTADAMERALEDVRAAVARAGIAIRILPGGEVAFDRLGRIPFGELRRFGLGGNPAYLLVETPYGGWPLDMEQRLTQLIGEGITPVLAHPERNPDVQAHPDRLARLVEIGTLVQVTATSLSGGSRSRSQETALRLIREGQAHIVASDAHGPHVARQGIDTVLGAIGDAALAGWLTEGVPSAITDGRPLPSRPESSQRSLRRRRGGASRP